MVLRFKLLLATFLLVACCSLPVRALDCVLGTGCTTVITSTSSSCTLTACLQDPLPPNTGSVSVTVSGTFTGTLQFEESSTNGTTWVSARGAPQPTGAAATSTTSTGVWLFNEASRTNFRVRASAFASGRAEVTATTSLSSPYVAGDVPVTYNGVATVGNGLPSFVGQVANTGFHATVATANILATTVASVARYRVGYYMFQSASGSGGACATNATATITFAWTDPGSGAGQAQPESMAAMNIPPALAAGAYQGNEVRIVAKPSTAITYAIAWGDGNCNTQPQASIYIYAEALN